MIASARVPRLVLIYTLPKKAALRRCWCLRYYKYHNRSITRLTSRNSRRGTCHHWSHATTAYCPLTRTSDINSLTRSPYCGPVSTIRPLGTPVFPVVGAGGETVGELEEEALEGFGKSSSHDWSHHTAAKVSGYNTRVALALCLATTSLAVMAIA